MSSSLRLYVERKLKGAEDNASNWELCGTTALRRNVKHLFEPWTKFSYDCFLRLAPEDISMGLQKMLEVDPESQKQWLESHKDLVIEGEKWYNPYEIYARDVSDISKVAWDSYTKYMVEAKTIAKSMGVPVSIDEDEDDECDVYEDYDYEKECSGRVVKSVIVDQISHMRNILDLGQILELCDIADEYNSEYDGNLHDFRDYDVRFVFVFV